MWKVTWKNKDKSVEKVFDKDFNKEEHAKEGVEEFRKKLLRECKNDAERKELSDGLLAVEER